MGVLLRIPPVLFVGARLPPPISLASPEASERAFGLGAPALYESYPYEVGWVWGEREGSMGCYNVICQEGPSNITIMRIYPSLGIFSHT